MVDSFGVFFSFVLDKKDLLQVHILDYFTDGFLTTRLFSR